MSSLNDKVLNVLDSMSSLNKQLGYEYSQDGDQFFSPRAVRPGKPFVIGLIPPDVPVQFVLVEKVAGKVISVKDVEAQQAPTGQAAGKGGAKTAKFDNVAALPDAFWDDWVKASKDMNVDPKVPIPVMLYESGMDPHATPSDYDPKTKNTAKGLIQFVKGTATGSPVNMSPEVYSNFQNLSAQEQIPYVVKYFNGGKPPAGWKDSGQMYTYVIASGALRASGYAANQGHVIYSKKQDEEQKRTYWASNKGLASKTDHPDEIRVSDMYAAADGMKRTPAYQLAATKIDEALRRGTNGSVAQSAGIVGGDGAGKPTYVGIASGSDDVTDGEQDNPLLQIGQNLQAAGAERQQFALVATDELTEQIRFARSVPSLVMYVNPKSFARHYEHQVDYAKGRRGPIVSMHMEKPGTISGKGTTGAQFSVRQSDGAGGLSNQNRIASLSYLNLTSLVSIFRNNGVLHTSGVGSDANNAGVPLVTMSCFIFYDRRVYIGSFDSFGVNDSAEKPFSLDYEFQFTVRYEVDVNLIAGPS